MAIIKNGLFFFTVFFPIMYIMIWLVVCLYAEKVCTQDKDILSTNLGSDEGLGWMVTAG